MDQVTKIELVEKAKEIGLKGYYKYNKKELYDILYKSKKTTSKSPVRTTPKSPTKLIKKSVNIEYTNLQNIIFGIISINDYLQKKGFKYLDILNNYLEIFKTICLNKYGDNGMTKYSYSIKTAKKLLDDIDILISDIKLIKTKIPNKNKIITNYEKIKDDIENMM